jgi:uncharacterized protein (DUF58 family)
MLPREILAKVRRIEILTGRLVSETFAGEYLSVFKGRGMEFAEVREYVPGDDIRAIDWNVTARTLRPYVRQYTEERELTVVIACDLSGSQFFGTATQLKKEIAAEISAVLAFSALKNNDKVGLILFTEDVEKQLPPRKGRRHVLHMIRDVLAYEPRRKGTRVGHVLDRVNRALKRRCILFLISDFRDHGYEKALKLAALRHDVIPILIRDPREESLPETDAVLEVSDPETGERACVDGRSVAEHAARESARRQDLERTFRLYGLEPIRVSTAASYIDPIVDFFRRRARRLRH